MKEIEGKFQNDGNPSIDGQLEALYNIIVQNYFVQKFTV